MVSNRGLENQGAACTDPALKWPVNVRRTAWALIVSRVVKTTEPFSKTLGASSGLPLRTRWLSSTLASA